MFKVKGQHGVESPSGEALQPLNSAQLLLCGEAMVTLECQGPILGGREEVQCGYVEFRKGYSRAQTYEGQGGAVCGREKKSLVPLAGSEDLGSVEMAADSLKRDSRAAGCFLPPAKRP